LQNGTNALGEWGSFEGAAFPEFAERVHVVTPFEIPEGWERFESMDFGSNHPTAWHAWAVDYDGNLAVFDEYYAPGLVTAHAAEIKRRRAPQQPVQQPVGLNWWEPQRKPDTWGTKEGWVRRNYCCADPSIGAEHGLSNRWGKPASIRNEFLGHGIALNSANNDRRAGYLRLLELIHPELDRIPPPWSQVPRELGAAPRLYIFATCPHLIEQLKNAPIRVDGRDAGEMVDANWESAHGHACASARYGAMSRPGPSPEPEPEPGDWREAEQRRLLSRHEDDSYYDEQRERNLIDV